MPRCPKCKGTGFRDNRNPRITNQVCRKCKGDGKVMRKPKFKEGQVVWCYEAEDHAAIINRNLDDLGHWVYRLWGINESYDTPSFEEFDLRPLNKEEKG